MAERPVFVPFEKPPFYRTVMVSFEWNGGFAKIQKQKNITALHSAFEKSFPGKRVFEISSKSMQEHGEDLSAFFLKKYVPELDRSVPVECVFQAAKTFHNGGPYKDLLDVSPREAKRDERLKNSGRLTGFTFENAIFPLEPKTIFYDYIYLNALLENMDLVDAVLQYDAFTDIEFNPERSINCQAKAAAAFVSLANMNAFDKIRDFETFATIYEIKPDIHSGVQKKIESKTIAAEKMEVAVKIQQGTILYHKAWGKGTVKCVENTVVKVMFATVGLKCLGFNWCMNNCEFR